MTFYNRKTIIPLLILFVVSFIFRIWIARLVPQPFVYDQDEYYGYVLGILNEGLHADIYRLYGYPLLVTPLIYFFGIGSPLPWTVFHAFLDAGTTVVVFLLSVLLFKQKKIAWMSSLVYAFNPYTSGYVGVLLSEIVTIFFISVIFVLVFFYIQKNTPRILFLLVFLLGFLPQIRPAFIYFSIFVFINLVWNFIRKKTSIQKIKIGLLYVLVFCLPFSYNVVTNLYHYHQLAFLSVDPVFEREFYTSLFIGRGMPFTDTKWGAWPPQAQEAWGAFSQPKNQKEREIVAKTYMNIAIQKISNDPAWYLRSRVQKMFYVWEKHFIYPYAMGTVNELQKFYTYWINSVLVGLGVLGIVLYIFFQTHKSYPQKIIGWLSLLFVVYISVVHSISTSEERFSLPAYPLLCIFATYSIFSLQRLVRIIVGQK